MGKRKTYKLTALGAAVALAATLSIQSSATASTRRTQDAPVLTDAQIAAMPPTAQALYLAPLRAAATALGAYGRTAGTDLFGSVGLNANNGTVDLYLTHPAQATTFEQAARSAAAAGLLGSVDLSLVRVHQATFSRSAMDTSISGFLARPHSYPVYGASANPDASGITVEVRDPAAAQAAEAAQPASAGPTLTFAQGSPRVAKSWNDVKWHDSRPFIGGDVLTPDGYNYCSAGLPAVRTSDNVTILVTAAHCFGVGTLVYTGGGATFAYGNGQIGNPVGQVTARAQQWDAETMPAQNNADESDTTTYYALTSTAYSYNGDYVCQAGARSAALGHPTPCGIKVTNQDLYFPVSNYTVRGVEGVDVNGWGSVSGDSGGTVFAVSGNTTRQLRGIVSAGGQDGTASQKVVDWTEAIDIFNQFGLKLNPVT